MSESSCRFDSCVEPYLDNALSKEEQSNFEEHLKECDICREQLELARKLDGILQEMEEDRAPAWLAHRVIARTRELVPEIDTSTHNWLGWMGGILIGISISAGLALIFLNGISPQTVKALGLLTEEMTALAILNSNWLLAFAAIPLGFGFYKAAQILGFL